MKPLAKIAALLMFASALLHLLIPILNGFTSSSMPPLFFAALLIVLGLMVIKNKRWAMWLSFFVMLIGGVTGMAGYLGGSVTPSWASLGIWVLSWMTGACLFIVLWRHHVSSALLEGTSN